MIRFYLLICCAFIVTTGQLAGQESRPLDRLHLINGQQLVGQLIAWDYEGNISFRDTSGRIENFVRKDYRRLTYLDENSGSYRLPGASDQDDNRPARTWFQSIEIGYTMGRAERDDDFFFGPGNDAVVGYQLAIQMGKHLSDRLRIGFLGQYSSYNHGRRERTVGAGLQARFLATQPYEAPAFYVQLESAYELPIGSNDQAIEEVEGGIAVHPSVGLLFGSGANGDGRVSLDIGYRFLETTYRTNSFRGSELRTPTYRRLVLRAGYQF